MIAESISDYFIKYFIHFVACVIPAGFLLSEINGINKPILWGFFTTIFASIISFLLHYYISSFSVNTFSKGYKTIFPQTKKGFSWIKLISFFALKYFIPKEKFILKNELNKAKYNLLLWWHNLTILPKLIFGILGITLLFTTIVNLIVVFVAYPNEWDSMTGHLVKCAYYIQNGNMNRLGGTTWTIDFYPNSLPTLQIFGYQLFHFEKGFKLIHYVSYWVFALASYGTAKRISNNFTASFFVFLVAALLPTALVQATTTETDIVLTAYLASLSYLLFSYKNKPTTFNLVLVGIMACIWIGHKVTFLLIAPAVAVVGIYAIFIPFQGMVVLKKKVLVLLSTLAIGFCLYVLPTGYIGNIREIGKFSLSSLSAPKEVMMWHGIDPYTGKEVLKYGTLNMARYASDFLNLDGIRSTNVGKQVNDLMRYFPEKALKTLNPERKEFTVVYPFYLKDAPIQFHQERPYWGIISFGMILLISTILLVKFKKYCKIKMGKSLLILMAAMFLHFLSLSYTAPYDPIKGRYFMNMAVWAMPMLIIIGNQLSVIKREIVAMYGLFVVVIVSLSAICIVLNKRIHPLFGEKTIFNLSRLEQMSLTRPDTFEPYQKFDELVPKNAVVALGTTNEDFEYQFWGEGFTRKLIPIHPFKAAVKPIPAEAEYLLYTKGIISYKTGDIQLNKEDINKDTPVKENTFYLRKLK